jgi:hypothetical protein
LAVPQGWVTVEAGRPAVDLYGVVSAWSGTFVRHALVPSGWQEKPGSLFGRAPDYPREMSRVAKEIVKLGMAPGISLDPLAASDADSKLTVTAKNGSVWMNLGKPEARAAVAKQVEKLVGQGFQFFVVERSPIPDDALEGMNVTREQADTFAMEIVSDAAGNLAVLPSPGQSLSGDVAQWRTAAQNTAGLQMYGVSAGPLRLDADQVKSVSAALAEAIKNFAGPLEIVGAPKKEVRTAVGLACCAQEPPRPSPVQGGSRD